MDLLDARPRAKLDGRSMMPLVRGEQRHLDSEFYITEATWMRKHGWRTPEWKLIVALEPDFHAKPPVELYNLANDPDELVNLADQEPGVVKMLKARMEAWIAKREAEEGIPNPMVSQECWHGYDHIGPVFKSSQQAYDTFHIGDPEAARKLQAKKH
jgi:arylsulfatase A-like enzyme